MQEDLERVGEINEVLIVRSEDDGLLALVLGEMEAKDVMQEEVGL